MNIALIGYGKMGKAIEEMAVAKGYTVGLKVDKTNAESFTAEALQGIDIAIEFSTPETVVKHIKTCVLANVPVVVGTTAWQQDESEVFDFCVQKNGTILYASNFSLGVNLFFALNKKLSAIMANFKQYEVSMQEIHHVHKLDAPSGTAITLANDILQTNNAYKAWHKGNDKLPQQLPIESLRLPDVPGTHSVKYTCAEDEIEIKHTAFNRNGFAMGAVLAAEWLLGKKGIFTMADVIKIT